MTRIAKNDINIVMTYPLRADDVSHHRAEAIDDNSVSTWGDSAAWGRERTQKWTGPETVGPIHIRCSSSRGLDGNF